MNPLVLVEQSQAKFNLNLFQPIKNYVRIRYTNFAINSRYLICGASSGGLYVFGRHKNALKFLFTIPSNNGRITSIVFSRTNLDLFAFGTGRGVFKLILLKLNVSADVELDKQQWQEIYVAKSFTKHAIRLIIFQDDDLSEFRLFLADDGFSIYMISRMKTFSSMIFKSEPPVRILSFDSPIHQLETNRQYLLVSGDDKSSIFNMETISLNKVGTKSRPNGVFGSCFYGRIASESLIDENETKFVFTARPSLRLWQANQEGNVICTHQFKDYLNKSNCNFIYLFDAELGEESLRSTLIATKTKAQLTNANFNQIYKIQIKGFTYLVTFTNVPRTMLFIINPPNAKVVFWTDQLNPITNIMISEDELIICHKEESNIGDDRRPDDERLFTLIKVFDLEEFIENEDHILSLSSLSLFCFLKENQYIASDLIKDNLKEHVLNEWSKLDDSLKSNFSDLIKLIEIKQNGTKHEKSTNEQIDCSTPGAIESLITDSTELKRQQNGTSNESIESGDGQNASLTNGKKSIDELTSKHRWKRQAEPIDEKRVLGKKLNRLKQSVDKVQIGKLKCKCNYPSPRAHQMLNGKQKEIRLILIKLLDESNLDEIMETCFEYAIWNLYLDLLILKRRFTDHIKISLLLMDIDLLAKNGLLIQIFKSDLALSRELFGLFVKQKNLNRNELNESNGARSAICLHCETNLQSDYIKWQDIIDFLYKNLKLNDLIDLLMIHHQQLPCSVLNSKLCIHLLQTEMIGKYESSLTNDKLTKLNQHLAIRSSKQKTKVGQGTSQWSMFLDLNARDCDICKKSLKHCRDPLLVFKCDHIYHKDCDETANLGARRACYVCTINLK